MHFLLYTRVGSLALVVVAAVAVAFVVWWAVRIVVTLVAAALWGLVRAVRELAPPARGPRPRAGGKA